MSLNGAKNNPKIVTKITAVRPKGGLTQGPLNTPLVDAEKVNPAFSAGWCQKGYLACKTFLVHGNNFGSDRKSVV